MQIDEGYFGPVLVYGKLPTRGQETYAAKMTLNNAPNSPPKTVINETLCFLQNAYNSYTKDQIETAIADFYDAEEIITAKETLTEWAKELNLERQISKHVPQRRTARGSNSADKQTVKDLIEIWDALDLHSSVQIQFVAKNCFRIAPIGQGVLAENAILMQAISSLSVEMSSMRKDLGRRGKGIERGQLISTAGTLEPLSEPLEPTAPSIDKLGGGDGGYSGGGGGDSHVSVDCIAGGVSTADKAENVVDGSTAGGGRGGGDGGGGNGGGVSGTAGGGGSDGVLSSGTFAALANNLGDDSTAFQNVKYKGRRLQSQLQHQRPKPKGLVGSLREEGSLLSAAPPRDYWDFHVGNIDGNKDTSADQIKSFMETRGFEPLNVWLVNKQGARRLQAKVRVKLKNKDLVLDSSKWPEGVTIRSWS